MMGTGPFAVPTFEALLKSEHDVVVLFTRPSRLAPGRRKAPPNPMRDVADRNEIRVLQPESINSEEALQDLNSLAADLMVVCDYGQILANETLGLTRLGGINLHGSLLPKYRGAAPINWAMYHGEKESGVTVIHMTPRLDAGPCLVRAATDILPDEDAVDLEQRLSILGVESVCEAIDLLDRADSSQNLGDIQDQSQASKAPRLKKNDGQIDWSRTAQQIVDQIRAFQPWPGSFVNWQRSGREALRVIIDQASSLPADSPAADLGTVAFVDGDNLQIATGEGVLAIERIKPAGKRAMPIGDFLRGHQIKVGDRFGD